MGCLLAVRRHTCSAPHHGPEVGAAGSACPALVQLSLSPLLFLPCPSIFCPYTLTKGDFFFFFKSYIHLLECVCREKCPGELSVTHRGRKPHSQRCDRHCGISSCFLGWPQELLVVPAHSFPHHSVGILLQLPEGRAGCSVTACKGTTDNLSTRLSLPSVQM